MSDVAVVGKFAGSKALGSVGSTTTLVMLFTGFLIGIGSGINSLVARYIGEGNDEAVASTARASAVVSVCAGLIISVLGISLSKPFLLLLNTKQAGAGQPHPDHGAGEGIRA